YPVTHLTFLCPLIFFFLRITPPPTPTLFPYTTLFRSYSRARSAAEAAEEIRRGRGTQFAPAVVDAFFATRLADLSSRRGERSNPDRKSTRLNSSHRTISYAVFCLKKKKQKKTPTNYDE